LLELTRIYPRLSVIQKTSVGEDEAYVIEALGDKGARLTFTVSSRTWLVLRREADGHTTTCSDFRNIDGEVVPHRAVLDDALGETTFQLQSIRFNAPVPRDAFAPAARADSARGAAVKLRPTKP
jgi:hypothetical protein